MTEQTYHAMGWIHFPITFTPKKDATKADGINKNPQFPKGWSTRTMSEWGANVAILTGQVSGITVVDFDDLAGYMQACREVPELLERYTVRTRRGYHIYFEYDEGLKNDADCFTIPHVDIRNDGGCAIAPPSSYEFEGETYTYELQGGVVGVIPYALRAMVTENGLKRTHPPMIEQPPTTEHDMTRHAMLREVVMGLHKKRADHRGDWIRVGMALHNSGQDIAIWNEFSRQSTKYRWGDCEKEWKTFHTRQSGLTERTLWWMLKDDHPTLQRALWKAYAFQDKAYQLLEDAGVSGHRYLAQHFVNCRPNDYLYDTESGWWYMEPTKTWKNCQRGYPPSLIIVVCDTLFKEVEDYLRHARTATKSEEEEAYNVTRLKDGIKLRENLMKAAFTKSIMEFCQAIYAEQTQICLTEHNVKNVHALMDNQPMLFAFQDAVYDLTLDGAKCKGVREIQPTDFIFTTCGYPYPARDAGAIHEVETALKTIWSRQGEYGDDGETYEFTMKMLSTALCGTRWCEAFYIMTGSGRNGKGLLFELMKYTMGNYYHTAAVQILTTRLTDATSATPELAELKGKRLVIATEPEANERLQEGTIKAMTGGDEITGRALYHAPVKFVMQAFLGLQCNTIPLFNGVTRGGVLRNVAIPFPFEFCDAPVTNRQKRGDPDIKNRLCKGEAWRNAMWYILLDHFEGVRGKARDAIPAPRLVRERTEEYIEENNDVGVWWEQTYEREEESYVLTRDAYHAYKTATGSGMSDKKFKEALVFNLLEPKKITSRTWNNGADRDKNGVKGWKPRLAMD